MLYPLWTAKPGPGCSTVALAFASDLARRGTQVLLVDLGGDLTCAAALATNTDGVTDWLAASGAGPASLGRLEVEVAPRCAVLPRGAATRWSAERADALHALLTDDDRAVVVDVGNVEPTPDSHMQALRRRFADGRPSLLVTRACYLAVRRAQAVGVAPSGIVLVREAGRELDAGTLSQHLGAPIVAAIDHDAAVARALDAGRLVRRPPRPLTRQVRRLAS